MFENNWQAFVVLALALIAMWQMKIAARLGGIEQAIVAGNNDRQYRAGLKYQRKIRDKNRAVCQQNSPEH